MPLDVALAKLGIAYRKRPVLMHQQDELALLIDYLGDPATYAGRSLLVLGRTASQIHKRTKWAIDTLLARVGIGIEIVGPRESGEAR